MQTISPGDVCRGVIIIVDGARASEKGTPQVACVKTVATWSNDGEICPVSAHEVLLESGVAGDVWITVNRPAKHNALSRGVLEQLAAAIARIGGDSATRCVVIRGAGDKWPLRPVATSLT